MEAGGARPNHNSMQVSGADFEIFPSTLYRPHIHYYLKVIEKSFLLSTLLLTKKYI